MHGGKVEASEHREYGTADITVIETGNDNADLLFKGLDKQMQVSLNPTSSIVTPQPELTVLLLPLLAARSGCRTVTR